MTESNVSSIRSESRTATSRSRRAAPKFRPDIRKQLFEHQVAVNGACALVRVLYANVINTAIERWDHETIICAIGGIERVLRTVEGLSDAEELAQQAERGGQRS